MREDFTPEWLSKTQVAKSEGVCTMTIDREVKRGKFPAGVRFPNNRLFWHISTIEAHRARKRALFGIGVPAAAVPRHA